MIAESYHVGCQAYAVAVTKNEVAHINYLRAAIQATNSTPVPQPALNLGVAFSTAAKAALGLSQLNATFSPYGSDVMFYLSAFIFEDVGSSACKFWFSNLHKQKCMVHLAMCSSVDNVLHLHYLTPLSYTTPIGPTFQLCMLSLKTLKTL